jgi:hypothetical protein
MSDGGKGSSPRPYSVSHEEFSKNWDNIFKKDREPKNEEVEDKVTRNNEETQYVKNISR